MIWSVSVRLLIGLMAAVGLLMLVVGSEGARAAFPGENGPIAFVKTDGATPAKTTIWKANPDGSGPVQLTESSAVNFAPAYSPDGKTIAYTSNAAGPGTASIWLMNADGSGKHRLTSTAAPFETNPAFSADGKRVYFMRVISAAEARVVSTRLDGTDEQSHLPGHSVWRVVALPDGRLAWIGRTLAECPDPSAGGPGCAFQVRVAKPDGSALRRLTDFPLSTSMHEVDSAADGKRLILSYTAHSQITISTGGIAALDPDGPENLSVGTVHGQRLTSNLRATAGTGSPDGSLVLFLLEGPPTTGPPIPPSLQTMSSSLPADPADTSTWQTVLTDSSLLVSPLAWLDWGPKPGTTPGGDDPGGDTPGGDTPGGDTPGGDDPGTKPRDPAKCKISWVRSRFFVFRKRPVIRLIARYRAKRPGQVRITFFERNRKNRPGRKLGRMNARFTATTRTKRKFKFIRVAKKRPPALMKKLRASKRGFIARLKVKNAPGYCRRIYNLDLRLSQLRFVDKQFVWFQTGTFKKGQKPPRYR